MFCQTSPANKKNRPIGRFFLLVLVSWIRCQGMRWFGIEAIAKMDAVRRSRRMRDKLPRNLQSASPAKTDKLLEIATLQCLTSGTPKNHPRDC